MATFPFLYRYQEAISANAAGVLTISVPDREKVEIHEIRHKSTAGFDFEGLSDSRGRNYTDAGIGTGIDADFFDDTADNNNGVGRLPVPIMLDGNVDLTIRVKDTSGSTNTIELIIVAVKTVPD